MKNGFKQLFTYATNADFHAGFHHKSCDDDDIVAMDGHMEIYRNIEI